MAPAFAHLPLRRLRCLPTLRSPRRLAAALAVIAPTVLAACGGLPGQGDVISPSQAVKVVRDYWKVNEQAVTTQDAGLFAKIQSGPLLDADAADARAARAAGDPKSKSSRPLRNITAFVPHQKDYPAQFLALVETVKIDSSGNLGEDPIGIYHHFVKASEGAAWKADFAAVAPLDHLARFALDRSGYASLLGSSNGSGKYVLEPKQLPGALSRYINSGVSTGSPEGPIAAGRLTTDAVSALRRYRESMGKLGYTVDLSYQPTEFLVAYQGADGNAIVAFTLQATNNVGVPDTSHCIVQPQDNLHRWGGLVPPGSYLHLVEGRLLQFLALDPSRKPGATVDVPAYAESEVSAATTPANPTCHG